MDVSIVMFKADGTRRDFPISRERFVIGRKNSCDLRIPLSSVSRQHCEIEIEGDQVKLRDLGSSNGTFHNDTRVQEAMLSAGDSVVIGPVTFTVVIDGEPAEIKPVRTMLNSASGADQSATLQPLDGGPESIAADEPKEEGLIGEESEPEALTPTTDLDDDPLSALEALADAEDDSDFDIDDLLDEKS